jgi:outer membrane protein assembly factor BamB/tetratricopeptide (TPR) repeat protein
MSWSSRRAILVLTALAVLGVASVFQHVTVHAQGKGKRAAVAQPAIGPGPGMPVRPGQGGPMAKRRPGYDLGQLVLPKDEDLKERLDAAEDRIKQKDWLKACETLQNLVGRPQDIFVPRERRDPDGSTVVHYVSVKKEAARLIGTLPKAGRAFYEANYGQKATGEVKTARGNNDYQRMAQTLALYLHTEAGAEAANWLASYMLDRAEFQGAARFFQILINRSGIGELKDGQLIKAAYAFHHAGAIKSKEAVLRELEKRGVEVRLGGEQRNVAELKDALDRFVASVAVESASDSPIYRGRPSRNAMLPGGTPFLQAAWRQKMVLTNETGAKIKTASDALAQKALPVYTSFMPVTATVTRGEKKIPLLIYRSYWGIHAVNMKTGKFEWESQSDWSLDRVLGAQGKDRDSHKVGAYSQWLDQHWLQSTIRPQILFENSILDTLSADSRMVYAIEDLAIPPPQHMVQVNNQFGGFGGNNVNYNWGQEVSRALGYNKLQGFELAKGGKLAWEKGGLEETDKRLQDTYFLGAPLPLNGKLYVLTEKMQELRLATLDPATGNLLALQPLATTKDLKLVQDPMRRIQACHLAHAEGILVVPTNAGAIFGVDLLSGSLAWAYPYAEKPGAAPPQGAPGQPNWGPAPPGFIRLPNGQLVRAKPTETHWQVTAPAIQDGKIVFTSPDARDIHCINLRDGTRLWTRPRDDGDLYLAGIFNGKVVVVGKTRTRALGLTRGDEVWRLETGEPAGQGAASVLAGSGESIYYLPIRHAPHTRQSEICAINVDRGLIHAHTRSRTGEVPGNLIFYEGSVLSQTFDSVVAYPQLEIKLAEMNNKVKDNPNDPDVLTERGDYLLDKGDLGGAIADFRRALKKENNAQATTVARARTKLYEAFTEYFQRDFRKAENYLPEYEEMCKIDLTNKVGDELTALKAEQRRRRANFLCLVGKGRESQNRLVEAFEKYLELGLEAQKDELIQVVDEPSVKAAPDVWSQGRIAAMVAKANDNKQKAALEAKIKERWSALKTSKTPALEDMRKFVSLFGSLFGVGKEARFTLAERLMEDTDLNSLLEAEQHLSLLRTDETPPVAARAIEALARLNTRKGLLEDAAYYYRLLGEKYPQVVVEGKRGEEYMEDLATDKRFLPYIDQAGRFVIKGKVKLEADEKRGSFPSTTQSYQFHHNGEPLPFFLRNRLALQLDWSHQLKLTDSATGDKVWGLTLTRTQFQQIAQNNAQAHRVRFGFQSLGHLVVLQLGHMVFAVDPLNKGRVLWEKNLSLLPNTASAPPAYYSLTHDPRDNSAVVAYSDGWVQRLGSIGPLQGGVICLQMRDSLIAVDPVSGRTLWTRSDVNSRAHIFGDEKHIYVVGMGENNRTTGSRVFRAYDGVSVKVPDFSAVYEQRMRVMGRHILSSHADAKGLLTMRVYDVLEGKDVWKREFPQGTIVMESEEPGLAGVVERTGMIRVLDVQTQKEVLATQLTDPKHIGTPRSVHLLADPDYVFVAFNGQLDGNKINGDFYPTLLPGAGMRSVPVNGYLYAFDRKSGKVKWYNQVEHEHLVLSQFEDLPLLFFTARYSKWVGNLPFRNVVNATTARAIAKHNGKLWYMADNVPYGMNFHDIKMDHRSGKVEVTGYQMKVTMTSVAR